MTLRTFTFKQLTKVELSQLSSAKSVSVIHIFNDAFLFLVKVGGGCRFLSILMLGTTTSENIQYLIIDFDL